MPSQLRCVIVCRLDAREEIKIALTKPNSWRPASFWKTLAGMIPFLIVEETRPPTKTAPWLKEVRIQETICEDHNYTDQEFEDGCAYNRLLHRDTLTGHTSSPRVGDIVGTWKVKQLISEPFLGSVHELTDLICVQGAKDDAEGE